MNLADIVRRKDRALKVVSGDLETTVVSLCGRKFQAVRLSRESGFQLINASEFEALRAFPKTLGWKLVIDGRGSGDVKFVVRSARDESVTKVLFETELDGKLPVDVELQWPVWAGDAEGYHLELSFRGSSRLVIVVGPAFNSRQQILGPLRGVGVEVGPGLNPHVLPSHGVEVRYIESVPADQWVALYKKQDKPSSAHTENLWGKYIVGSAHDLSVIEDESLDFIFSNHVFEHLMNPLGVLENWRKKLKAGGVVAGVVPDCRFTFDLRQTPSCIEELESERIEEKFEIDYGKYERWCRFTAPYNTPENLIARQYSIHVHYYTPERFRDMARILIGQGTFRSLFLDTSPNNKDFGFLLKTA